MTAMDNFPKQPTVAPEPSRALSNPFTIRFPRSTFHR
jgi:hypothetical protein